jgi:hypothetical protein
MMTALKERKKILSVNYGFFNGAASTFKLFGNPRNIEILRDYFKRGYQIRSMAEAWQSAGAALMKAVKHYEEANHIKK